MKKTLFFLLILSTEYFVLSPKYCHALDPIIITETKHSYPVDSGSDQNYIPSDPTKIETTSIVKTVNISESFSPILIGGSGSTTYQHQTIDKIKEQIDSHEINTGFYRQNYEHFARPLANPLDSDKNIRSAFTSYSFPQSPNATRRSLPDSVRKCLVSNEITDISGFIARKHTICIDREISTSAGKIRVGEIFFALNQSGYPTYYPDSKCPPNQEPKLLPSSIATSLKKVGYQLNLSQDDYLRLYQTLEPVCSNSLAQEVEHCDLNDQGKAVNCKKEVRSQALGAVPASAKNTIVNYLPVAAKVNSVDYSQTENVPAIQDKPNPLSWLAQFFKMFYDGELSETKTFSGPQQITTKVDNRQIDGLDTHKSALLNFIPSADQSKLQNLPASGTNDVTLDPGEGNLKVANSFYNFLTPKSWH